MDQKQIFNKCKEFGCCDACGLRYLGIRNPKAYENAKEFALRFQDKPEDTDGACRSTEKEASEATQAANSNGHSPPNKKHRGNPCVTCLGLLQEEVWSECNKKVKELLDKKRYECTTFACALSAPIVTILRERVVSLRLSDACKDYDAKVLTPLKEAWKWSFGTQLASHLGINLDAGHVSPLLVTLHMEYPDDLQELEVLKILSPSLFESRSQQKKRFTIEFTRRSVEQALEGVTLEAISAQPQWGEGGMAVTGTISCVSVACAHAPAYVGGRYIKLSRELPQTPWLINGRRMMESSVQEIIFESLAKAYGMSAAECEHRLKFMAAGREDVDVRCLGDGRPFAVEVTDPNRQLSADELNNICEQISNSGQVVVKKLVPVTKEDLIELKKAEETKRKTYEALCIKLTHSEYDTDLDPSSPVTVTDGDIRRINSFRNTPEHHEARIVLTQRTPIRVLHRRPLLVRTRYIYELHAELVPEHPRLMRVRIVSSAGAYIKEWVHGDVRRTRPALGHALGHAPGHALGHARADLLALDVCAVHALWPPQ